MAKKTQDRNPEKMVTLRKLLFGVSFHKLIVMTLFCYTVATSRDVAKGG